MTMRISIVFLVVFSALAACSLAAPAVLERKARQTVPSSAANMNALITGLNLLSKNSKFHLVQSLNVSCSCLNSDSTGACQTLRSALNTTCRLYEANSVLSSISLPNQTAKQVLNVMSERSIEDACIWLNETLRSAGIGSSGLPSSVQCSSVSTLSGVCSQWSEFVSIMKIGSKVDRLGASPISEKNWFKRHLIYGSPERC